MNYKKIVPAVALTVGMAASITAAQAESLFQLSEVSSSGTLIAEAEHHDGAKADQHKACEHKDGKHEKDAKHHADHHKDGEHHCGADKKDKKDGADKDHGKDADHKCAAGACGAHK
jgi:hypothetical protein